MRKDDELVLEESVTREFFSEDEIKMRYARYFDRERKLCGKKYLS